MKSHYSTTKILRENQKDKKSSFIAPPKDRDSTGKKVDFEWRILQDRLNFFCKKRCTV